MKVIPQNNDQWGNSLIHDHYHHEVKIGSFVAFNLSGEVRLGTVTNIKHKLSNKVFHSKVFHIREGYPDQEGGAIARVTRSKNLVVLS